MSIALPGFETASFHAVIVRELRAALVNRYLQAFSALALGAGIAAISLSETASAAAFFILQVALYFLSLFALLGGVSSARAENEEWPMLFAQPIPRFTIVLGKFAAVWGVFSGVLLLLFIPALFGEGSPATLLQLYLNTLGLAAIFSSLGLCAGILSLDRVQALVLGVSAWLFLLVGVDLVALFAAQWTTIQKLPDLWVVLLMLNPLDAFRIQTLFAMEQIPAEAANKTPVAAWWLSHANLWFTLISVLWSATLLWLAGRRLARLEM